MKYILRNLRFPVSENYDLPFQIGKKLNIPASEVELISILRKAVDTRRKNLPVYDFTVLVSNDCRHSDLSEFHESLKPEQSFIKTGDKHPYIIGMGPAGLFCALAMIRNGLEPILFDQGESLDDRALRVQQFWQSGVLNEDSNVQFGEGGAGAFSDGKLTSRNRDAVVQRVYDELIRHGAEASISYDALPHLGTDGIRAVVQSIRRHLVEHGCTFHYSSKLNDVHIVDGQLKSIRVNNDIHQPSTLILALGNSARTTFRMLHRKGLRIEAKPFAVGVRIEQSQAMLNRSIYGNENWAQILGPATYRLTHNGTYTFCMCPGGFVIGAASERDSIVTNGMSYEARNGEFCNSAIVSTVDSKDFGNDLFAGMDFQQQIERSARREGYLAPAQYVSTFLNGKERVAMPRSSFQPGVYRGNLSTLFPERLTNGLKSALHKFELTVRDFTRDAVLIAPETRTSSPVRILRDQDVRASLDCAQIYPIGEGSGYAGGIISSAADGYSLGLRLK